MADLFDALAARALGTAPALAPALSPRFAPAADDPQLDLDEPPDLTAVTSADVKEPVARRTPEPIVNLLRREKSRAGDEPAPAARVETHQPPDDAATPDRPPQPEPTVRPARPDPLALAEPQSVPLRSPRGPGPAAASPRQRVRPTPVEVHGEPRPEPSPARPAAVTEPAADPIVATRAVRPAEPASPVDPAHIGPAPEHEPPLPPVHVTVSIGHVEVRAPARPAPAAPPQQPRWPQPRLPLEDYLRRDGRR